MLPAISVVGDLFSTENGRTRIPVRVVHPSGLQKLDLRRPAPTRANRAVSHRMV
jgi:hypothetical protein